MPHKLVLPVLLFVLFALLLMLAPSLKAQQQDTLRLSFPDFLEMSMQASNELKARQRQVNIAESRHSEARASRFLPNATATTAHGLLPGVKASDPSFSRDELYLDPGLRNDWEDWAFFNQLEISALQPIYTWGAISNAIKAAQSGVKVAEYSYRTEQQAYELQLFQLYQAKLLSMELQRLIDDARSTLDRAERELNKMIDEGDDQIEDADVYQFEIFKYQFYAQADEIDQNSQFVDRAWRIALGDMNSQTVYLPETNFLDPVEYVHNELTYYQQYALSGRPELHQMQSVKQAAQHGLDATIAQNYPALILGITGRYAYAPNRPRQRNPFISNVSNTSSVTFGFGFRQSLNFMQLKSRTERSREQLRQAGYAVDAVKDGIHFEVAETYKNYLIARSRYENTEKSLDVSRQWLRQEQLDYDIGFGDVLNLVDAMKSNLELEAAFKQRIHDLNVNTGKLFKTAGIPLRQLFLND